MISSALDGILLYENSDTCSYDIRQRHLVKTSSPSIDILKASNLERMLYVITDGKKKSEIAQWFKQLDTEKFFVLDDQTKGILGNHFWAQWCSGFHGNHRVTSTDADAKKTIKETYDRYGVLLDPHTAVAKFVADRFNERPSITK